jgi:hypothetical protein
MGGRYRTEEYRPRTTLGEMAATSGITANSISIQIEINQKKYWGFLNPAQQQLLPGIPASFELYFWGEYQGTITYFENGWHCSTNMDQLVIDKAGEFIIAYIQ